MICRRTLPTEFDTYSSSYLLGKERSGGYTGTHMRDCKTYIAWSALTMEPGRYKLVGWRQCPQCSTIPLKVLFVEVSGAGVVHRHVLRVTCMGHIESNVAISLDLDSEILSSRTRTMVCWRSRPVFSTLPVKLPILEGEPGWVLACKNYEESTQHSRHVIFSHGRLLLGVKVMQVQFDHAPQSPFNLFTIKYEDIETWAT